MCALLQTDDPINPYLLILNSHFSCCDNDDDRQEQVDELVQVLREWRLNDNGPFDLPEGESEIIGYNVEYSSMRFAAFFLSEFFEVVLIAAIVTVLFLGGWQIPWVDPKGLAGGWIRVAQVGAFIGKTLFVIWVMMLARWTLPRFRYDQVMKLGWKVILPLSLLNIFVTAIVLAIL
jgi:NADH-quinone oxidoreductase subunit H